MIVRIGLLREPVAAIGIAAASAPNSLLPVQSPGNSQPGGLFRFDPGADECLLTRRAVLSTVAGRPRLRRLGRPQIPRACAELAGPAGPEVRNSQITRNERSSV